MRTLLAVICAAGMLIITVCVDGTPMRAEQGRVVRLVRSSRDGDEPTAGREYARTMPDVDINIVDGPGRGGTVSAIQKGAADLAFILADVAYFANLDARNSRDTAAELSGIAALQASPVHILVHGNPRLFPIDHRPPLRVAINSAFSSQFMLANLVLGAYGLTDGAQPMLPSNQIAVALQAGSVDAVFVTAHYPSQSVAAATNLGARLLSMDDAVAESLRRRYPFVHRVNIPSHTYAGQETTIRTIGVDRILVCRRDLDEALVHELTRHFIEVLPAILQPMSVSASLMDLEQASATPIPLHPGAARYYRERELAP